MNFDTSDAVVVLLFPVIYSFYQIWAFATRPNILNDVEHVPFENGKHQKLLCTLVQVWVERTRVVHSVLSGGLQLEGSMDMDCKVH